MASQTHVDTEPPPGVQAERVADKLRDELYDAVNTEVTRTEVLWGLTQFARRRIQSFRRSREKSRYIEAGNDHKRLRFSWRTEPDYQRGVRTHTYRIEELEGARRSWRHDPIDLAWFTAEDLDRLGREAGLEVRHRYQDFERTPWETGATQMIWVYARG